MQEQKIRIDFLDGIRGASALFVVLFHAMLFTGHGIEDSHNPILDGIKKIVSTGHISVSTFIVLSGFCLAIPVVRNNLFLRGGFKTYIKRRANRIIMPYYCALLFSILLYFLFPLLQVAYDTAWDSKIPLTTSSVISHIFLVHNLNEDWIFKINGAHWSVATEWQIYFVFPILLYIWRKFNLIFSLFVSVIITGFFYYLVPFAEPQFILLFFMGVIASYFAFTSKLNFEESKYFNICILLFIPICLAVYYKFPSKVIYQTLFGFNFSILLFIMVKMVYKNKINFLIRFFSTPILSFFGKISYSLYLIHGPILALCNLYLLINFNLPYNTLLILMWLIVVPFSILLSYIFYYLVERRFLNN